MCWCNNTQIQNSINVLFCLPFCFSYFLLHFDSVTNSLPEIQDELKRDVDVVRHNIFAAEDNFIRPCQSGPCQWGELPNPDHERRVWKQRTMKKLYLDKIAIKKQLSKE
jgi:hypothetical protein